MKILSWNVRGLGNSQTVRRLRHTLKVHNPQIVFFMETKIDKSHMERVRRSCGFINSIDVEAMGSRGGLYLAWNGDTNVLLQSFSKRHIDVVIEEIDEGYKWRFTGFYGSPYQQDRDEAWNLLRQLRTDGDMPWMRRKRNFIRKLQSDEGGETDKIEEMEEVARTYFQNMFSAGRRGNYNHILSGIDQCIFDEDNSKLKERYTKDEIWEALKEMGPTKAPGEDGFSALFYQKCWPIIGEDATSFCLNLLNKDYELLHTLKQKRVAKKGLMAVKLDMSKAYDKYFTPSRGLRQDDPLSPFLFLFCGEGLSSLMRTAMKKKINRGVKASRSGPQISHLLFADDCILFGEATERGAVYLKQILHEYEKCSGQSVNYAKSTIFFSSNTQEGEKRVVTRVLGVRSSNNSEKYLGLPNLVGRKKKTSFQSLKDRLLQRIDNWSIKHLSQGGNEIPNVEEDKLQNQRSNVNVEFVSDLIDKESRSWKTELLVNTFHIEIVKKIMQIPLARAVHDDFQVWGGEPSGVIGMKKTVFTFFYNVLQRRKYGEIYNFLGCLIVTIKKFRNGLLRFSTREQVNSVIFSAVDYGSSGQVSGLIVRAMDGEILASKSVLHSDVASPFAAEAFAGLDAIRLAVTVQMIGQDIKRAAVDVDWH
ncbi:hypothetical protein PVK06_034655 [Gossypium arboreum]|uniref:Reverse transcriptase n=1 Tax=Gossypium arboreum TaxID=29729 RepID=A0ABR0NFU9_GOSAR|nr:hypothetical protein PVK06_034655 [Gossypium arboreum]